MTGWADFIDRCMAQAFPPRGEPCPPVACPEPGIENAVGNLEAAIRAMAHSLPTRETTATPGVDVTAWRDLSEAEIRARLSRRGVPGQDARALVNAWFRGMPLQQELAGERIDELLAR